MRRAWVYTCLAAAAGVSGIATPAGAAVIPFDFMGKAGAGLLSGNENGTINGTPGSGGEVGAGNSFDNVTNVLTLNFGFGSGNGFTNLSGNATASHIHGATPSPAPASFNENRPVLIGIDDKPGWNNSASSGGFSGTLQLTPAQAIELMEGRYYVNVHTGTNTGGEIRGNLVPVPEPGALAAVGLAGLGLVRRRRR